MLRRVAGQDAYASLALDGELSRADLPDSERRLATELVYGVLRHDARLDRALSALARRGLGKLSPVVLAALRVGAYQILFLDRVPAHAAVNDAASAARKVAGPKVAGFVNGVLRKLADVGEPELPAREDPDYAQVAFSLPAWLIDELRAAVPDDELVDAAQGLVENAPIFVRANSTKASRDDVAAALASERPGARIEAVDIAEHALAVTGLGSPQRSDSFQQGLWTVQDLGAQLVARLVEPQAGQHILDACAGVGGKTTYLAELSGSRAAIDAADSSRRKLDLLGDTIRRLGVDGIRAVETDLTAPGDELRSDYDTVLLDAPCSGLGVLRRHPEAKRRVTARTIDDMAALQSRLADAVVQRVRPGGAFVYSVCTFTAKEGPAQIERLVAAHPDLSVETELTTWPHRSGADAFFAARLRRRPS